MNSSFTFHLRPVAVRLAGVGVFEMAIAGKPDCYVEVWVLKEFVSRRIPVAARLAGGGVLEIAVASKSGCDRPDGIDIAFH